MLRPVKILIVEDEMIIGAHISLQLSSLGYEVTGIVPRGEEALLHIRENQPDIVLLDIQLEGEIDGIQVATLMQREFDIPIIYLTANADDAHFDRAKATRPYAFIPKPFQKLDLQRAIELTVSKREAEHSDDFRPSRKGSSPPYVLKDSIFVRHHDKMVKVAIRDVLYIEAERNYCRVWAKNREFVLVMTLKEMDERLPPKHFIRVHRSFIVNLSHIKEVATSHLVVADRVIPLSKPSKDELLLRILTI